MDSITKNNAIIDKIRGNDKKLIEFLRPVEILKKD
jgi:hypothetical protein